MSIIFFEDENKIRPNISKFYLPLPRINIKLVQLGGTASLQYLSENTNSE